MSTNESLFNLDYQRLIGVLFKYALFGGAGIFILSFGFLYLSFNVYPVFYETYLDGMFNAGGGRDAYFYLHPFILAGGLAVLWYRFRRYLTGNIFLQGIEFGLMYGIIALIPILWITFSAINITTLTVFSWLVYGTVQAGIAGVIFAWLNNKK
ncbi:MAG: hypothetical protein H7X99_09185 [Saprospiraceae bacterium]|nr:hypothetical protein [Saprospiraceae bacterium]